MPSRPGFEYGRLQHIGRADADALVALDAAFKEPILLDGTGWADDLLVEILVAVA